MLKINDKVIWKGSWGSDAPKEAKVTDIELTNGEKYGIPLDEVEWSKVFGRNVVVSLDNGSWAYGSQISKL